MTGRFDKGFNPWTAMFGPGGPGFGRPNFRWRLFDRGDLKYMILELLRDDDGPARRAACAPPGAPARAD